MDVVAYYRVSTGKQEASGLGLEAQRAYVEVAARQQGWTVVAEYTEAVSGAVAPVDRPECAKALAHNLPILVAKLDRIGRDVAHIATLMKTTQIKVATMPQADNFQLHLFAALAEQEKAFIGQRTKDALKALKERANGGDIVAQQKVANRATALSKGRTQAVRDSGNEAIQARANAFALSVQPHLEACLYRGLKSLRTVATCLNERGIATPRGGSWSAQQVSQIMSRLSLTF